MPFTISRVLALVACIILVLAAFGVALPLVEIGWLGLAFLAAAFVVP